MKLTIGDCSDGPLSLEPSSSVFHYAQCLFEGLKAYRDDSGKVTLFRPDLNMRRMNTSATRIALPVSNIVCGIIVRTLFLSELQWSRPTVFDSGTRTPGQALDPAGAWA